MARSARPQRTLRDSIPPQRRNEAATDGSLRPTGGVSLSSDGGATFDPVVVTDTTGHGVPASMSNDGTKMIATQNAVPGFGNTTELSLRMQGAVISGDGSTIVGIADQLANNEVYVSTDDGVSWTSRLVLPCRAGNLLRVAVSTDGQTIVATTYNVGVMRVRTTPHALAATPA